MQEESSSKIWPTTSNIYSSLILYLSTNFLPLYKRNLQSPIKSYCFKMNEQVFGKFTQQRSDVTSLNWKNLLLPGGETNKFREKTPQNGSKYVWTLLANKLVQRITLKEYLNDISRKSIKICVLSSADTCINKVKKPQHVFWRSRSVLIYFLLTFTNNC